MDVALPSMAGSVAQNVPRHIPDLRPAADAAATQRQVRPPGALGLPGLPSPPAPGQAAAVSRSMLAADAEPKIEVAAPSRVLKPYGVHMLPAYDVARAPERAIPDRRGAIGDIPAERTAAGNEPNPHPATPTRDEPTRAEARSVTQARILPAVESPPAAPRPETAPSEATTCDAACHPGDSTPQV